MITKTLLISAVPVLLLMRPVPCVGQWLTQQISLVPGWNAVYLEVQPEPRACDEIFRSRPVQSVWKWDRRFSTIQFTVDPATLLPEKPDWLMWLPPSDSRAFLNRLFELQGCQAYLIKVATNAAPFTLSIKGRVMVPRLDWYPHSLNLVGFPVNPQNPPTFADFFRFTAEVNTTLGYANQLFRIDSSGRGQQIVQPARERILPGVAYWVGCDRAPDGISVIDLRRSAGKVDFGVFLTQQDVFIRNRHPTATLTLNVRQRDSEMPPLTGGYPELAGAVPLSVLFKNSSNVWEWVYFPAGGLSQALAPGEEWKLQLGVRRQDLVPYWPQGTNGAAYQSILEITESTQSLLVHMPAVVEAQAPVAMALPGHDDYEGLWVGQVNVSQVNAPAWPAYRTNLLSTPAPASFRLLVHVDGFGQARLLQQALLAWDSTQTNAPHTKGTYIIYAGEKSLPADATDVKRISSVVFPPMSPVSLAGSISTALSGTVTVNYDDPTNPFLHRYHPLHDNRDWDFRPYSSAVETRTITRNIALQSTSATNAAANPYWGVQALRGTYQETLTGLRAQPIQIQGAFVLERISQINTLQ